ncbi:MAG: DUF2934 domain-containing protein [Planctomycetes bacterium]|nr:DUF2934 domain-containing protein [Planctomycetota bacterium]
MKDIHRAPVSSTSQTVQLDKSKVRIEGQPKETGRLRELIAQRAYAKWIAGGRRTDSAVQDWLQAEAEIKAEIRRGRRLHA